MKHAARATSAAPTYFEPALIPIGGVDRALIDGGVFMNSPSVSAYAEAKKIFGDSEEFFILSIGTGQLIRPISFSEAKDWGKAGWLAPLLSCMFDGVSDAANYQMNMFLGDRYVRLQTDLTSASDDMDNATNGNIENLKAEAKKMIRTCVFWLKLDKVSRRNWTRIPFEPGHGFWLKLDKDSSANWTHQIARG